MTKKERDYAERLHNIWFAIRVLMVRHSDLMKSGEKRGLKETNEAIERLVALLPTVELKKVSK